MKLLRLITFTGVPENMQRLSLWRNITTGSISVSTVSAGTWLGILSMMESEVIKVRDPGWVSARALSVYLSWDWFISARKNRDRSRVI